MIASARLFRASGAACLLPTCMLGMLAVLAGCAPSASDAPLTADQAARAACRQQTEQAFNIRNRADLYRPDYGRDSPLSGQASPQIDRGLADRFSYEQDYQDCLRSRGGRQTPTPQTSGALPTGQVQPALAQPGTGRPPSVRAPAAPASPSDLTRPPSLTE